MATASKGSTVETRTIEPVPDSERHGSPRSQLTLWMGANLQITAIVDGALAVIFGADPTWALIGLLIGNALGAAVTALHAAQGPSLGLPQMISSRAQFGLYGALLPLVLVVMMYLGFAATGTVLSGQAINKAIGLGSNAPWVGIIIFGAITATLAILGYRYIHKLGKIGSYAGMAMLAYLAVCLFAKYDVAAIFAGNKFNFATFLLAISLGAGWQLTYGPYVADYSRYLPRNTPQGPVFGWCFAGLMIGSMLSMSFGVMLAGLKLPKAESFMANQVGFLGTLGGGGLIAMVIYLVIVVGKLTVNTLNAYGGCMTILTTVSSFGKRKDYSPKLRAAIILGFIAVSVLIALLASASFLAAFKNFVLLLLMFFTPWSAINLVDYYLVSKERVDIPALYDVNGRYGKWNVPALVTYFVAIIAQIPFLSTALYTGPMTKVLGGADISWLIGLILPTIIYAIWGPRSVNVPAETILMPGQADLGDAA